MFKTWHLFEENLRPSSTQFNPVSRFLYFLAFPLALLCRRFGATPNQITLFSLLSSLVAFAGLALNQINFFFLFWALSVIADFADGTLARLTSNFSKFRVDHYTDVFKIGIVLLGMGIYFENPEVWLSTSFAMFSFFVFTSLNDSKSVKLPPQQTYKGTKVRPETGDQSKSRLREIKSATLVTLFTFNGHSLLLFFLMPLSEIFAVAALSYIGVICSLHYLLLWRRILVDSGD